jgi:hypothetical protein
MISLSEPRVMTLDDFAIKPISKRMQKFFALCEYYRDEVGSYPESPYFLCDFIEQNHLPHDICSLKLVSFGTLKSYYQMWARANHIDSD